LTIDAAAAGILNLSLYSLNKKVELVECIKYVLK